MTLKLYSSYSNIAEGVGSVVDSENGSFQNQIAVACRERLVKQQSLHGNLFVQSREIPKRRPASWSSKTVHTASQQVYANEHDEEKDCSFYCGKCHELKGYRIYAESC